MNVFVFGSNLAGRHGAGSALEARRKHGAVYGQGEGLQGRSYAIPTKDEKLRVLPLDVIAQAVNRFLEFATKNHHLEFNVVRIGCGLAGYKDEEIAPMFYYAPNNVILDPDWEEMRDKAVSPWSL